jgi:DNA-binding transcriptional MerR regulator
MVASEAKGFFSTEQVAAIVGLDPQKDKWRVIKFAQSDEYGIRPSVRQARGSGSRRLYSVEDVCEIALALRLLETGLRSMVIGRVIGQLRTKGKLSERAHHGGADSEKEFLAILRKPETGKPLDEKREQVVEWVGDARQAEGIRRQNPTCDLILVPVGSLFVALSQSVQKELSRNVAEINEVLRRRFKVYR